MLPHHPIIRDGIIEIATVDLCQWFVAGNDSMKASNRFAENLADAGCGNAKQNH